VTATATDGSRVCVPGGGESTVVSRRSLLRSPHSEVRVGATTGDAFAFDGVLFSPIREDSAATPKREPEALARFASHICPPGKASAQVDMVAPSQRDLDAALAAVPIVVRSSGAARVAIGAMIALTLLGGYVLGGRTARFAAAACNPRVEACK
jgi:hypothetical protein